ncbi:MAG: HPP family protein [Haloarculaceae archaeon]
MSGPSPSLASTIYRRATELCRRELRAYRRWIETTENMLHLVVLLVVPLLLAFVTWLSNVTPFVSFLVYPPLASGTYTLFADPESEYSSPRKFVGGMTVGALCGWLALEVSARYWYTVPPDQFHVHAGATALSVFLTGLSTWVLDLEEPTAFSAALLALVTGAEQLVYVAGIALSSGIVAGAYTLWYDHFYEHRAQYLYQTVQSDDHVLVPLRGERDEETALFAAYLAAAHEAGKVVLYRAVPEDEIDEEAVAAADSENEPGGGDDASRDGRDEAVAPETELVFESDEGSALSAASLPAATMRRLGTIEEYIEETVDIPCEMVVAQGDPDDPGRTLETARAVNCDLIVSTYDMDSGREEPSPYILGLFRGDIDVIAFSPTEEHTSWSRILVMVRRPGEIAHAMIDFARRLAPAGNVTICSCIAGSGQRRAAASMLQDLAGSFQSEFQTHVSHGTVEEYLTNNSGRYDLVMIGASTDRGTASRMLSPPTFQQFGDIDCDLAVVHRG